jgi:hypothetical protein
VLISNEADPGSRTDQRTVPGAVQRPERAGQASVLALFSVDAGGDGEEEHAATAASMANPPASQSRRTPKPTSLRSKGLMG